MNKQIGALAWIIPDGFTPVRSSGLLESHEAICIVNCTTDRATVNVTVYFEDDNPIENIQFAVEGQRTKHVRTDALEKQGMKIPKGVPYAMKVESDTPIVVQYSRMDATQAENTLMTTMAYPV
ncbi:sensory rhodopsin transducer [Cohnella cholangitidis]|uniref:Sensory rhodopsin transducer n=1 Tax=Cohnella cholangitidis TaxID=2598458 RepID=A0A7G5C310_9BACL|nr:sensory rhodopsin transducer [Cohnella cholangitidis]QMV43594.1 hypothetical protein FPL14_22250 [Cohnella cholangitidis]